MSRWQQIPRPWLRRRHPGQRGQDVRSYTGLGNDEERGDRERRGDVELHRWHRKTKASKAREPTKATVRLTVRRRTRLKGNTRFQISEWQGRLTRQRLAYGIQVGA